MGVLRHLASVFPHLAPDVVTGVSAGGINAAYLAAHQESFGRKLENLVDIWSSLSIEDVFRVDLRDLASRTARWGGRLLSGGHSGLPRARSLVDTTPLRSLLDLNGKSNLTFQHILFVGGTGAIVTIDRDVG